MSAFGDVDRTYLGPRKSCYTKTRIVLNYSFDTGIIQGKPEYVYLNYDMTITRECVCISAEEWTNEDCDSIPGIADIEFGASETWECTKYNYCFEYCDRPNPVTHVKCACSLNEGAVEFIQDSYPVTATAGKPDASVKHACVRVLSDLVGPESDHFRCSCDC